MKCNTSRKQFLQQLGMVVGGVVLPVSFYSCQQRGKGNVSEMSSLRFGIAADIHADLIPDKMERLERFISKSIDENLDFIVQLGDFCFPKPDNIDFMKLWNQFEGPKYHLLGNHDMDVSSKSVTMEYWQMPDAYYSFDQKGIHFVVLDPNFLFFDSHFTDYDSANFYVDDSMRTYIPPEQIEWLINDLRSTNLHAIILSHQSLVNPSWGIKNRIQIQEILEKENQLSGFQKVIACFNGHDHIDFHRTLNGIHYVEINSMSYQWLGEKYSNTTRYPSHLYEEYQHLDKLGTYKDALYAMIELDHANGHMKIEGVQSEWLAPSPQDLNIPEQVYGMQFSAEISNRVLGLK